MDDADDDNANEDDGVDVAAATDDPNGEQDFRGYDLSKSFGLK